MSAGAEKRTPISRSRSASKRRSTIAAIHEPPPWHHLIGWLTDCRSVKTVCGNPRRSFPELLAMHLETRVIVTGGAGFLGSHLCERLLKNGANLICVDNFFTALAATPIASSITIASI
jgi:hypothetical protein